MKTHVFHSFKKRLLLWSFLAFCSLFCDAQVLYQLRATYVYKRNSTRAMAFGFLRNPTDYIGMYNISSMLFCPNQDSVTSFYQISKSDLNRYEFGYLHYSSPTNVGCIELSYSEAIKKGWSKHNIGQGLKPSQLIFKDKISYLSLEGGSFGASLSLCPLENLSILSSSLTIPEYSQAVLLGKPSKYDDEDYVWEYSLDNGSSYRAYSGKGSREIRFWISDLSGVTVGQKILFRLRTCEGGSVPVEVRFTGTLPSFVHSEEHIYGICADQTPPSTFLEWQRALHPDESLDEVFLAEVDESSGKILCEYPLDYEVAGTKLLIHFQHPLSDGKYFLFMKGRQGLDEVGSTALPIWIHNAEAYTLKLLSAQDPTCPGSTNGSVQLETQPPSLPSSLSFYLCGAEGGFAPVVAVANPDRSYQINGLSKGSYLLKLQDDNLCESNTQSVLLQEPEEIAVTFDLKHPSGTQYINGQAEEVNDGEIRLFHVENSGTGYSVEWSKSGEGPIQSLQALSEGTYIGQFRYQNNLCRKTYSVDLERDFHHLEIDLEESQSISCHGDNDGALRARTLQGSYAKSYRWYRDNRLLPLAFSDHLLHQGAGLYRVEVESRGLLSSFEYRLGEPSLLGAEVQLREPLCALSTDGLVEWTPQGGTPPYQYTWDDGFSEGRREHLAAGEYKLSIGDAHGCLVKKSVVLTAPPALRLDSIHSEGNPCPQSQEGAATLFASGGVAPYQWEWEGSLGDSSLTNLSNGTYAYTLRDAHGCSLEGSLVVASPEALQLRYSELYPPSYLGAINGLVETPQANGRIYLEVGSGTPPYQYQWSDGSTEKNRQGLSAGRYGLRITDHKGCYLDTSFVLSASAPLVARVEEISSLSCFGGTNGHLRAQGQGGTPPYRWSWSTKSQNPDIDQLSAGTYQLVLTDAKGVESSFTYHLQQPPMLELSLQTKAPRCPEGSDGLLVAHVRGGSGPYQYHWSVPTPTNNDSIIHLSAGDYSLTVADAKGCSSRAEAQLVAPAAWTWNIQQKTPSYAGTIYGETPELAADGHILISLSGGTPPYRYILGDLPEKTKGEWTQLSPGNYPLRIIDQQQCLLEDSVHLARIAPLESRIKILQPIACPGYYSGSIEAQIQGGTPPYTFSWNEQESIATTLEQLGKGSYSLKINDALGVLSLAKIELVEPPKLQLSLQSESLTGWKTQDGVARAQALGGTPPYRYRWGNSEDSVARHLGRGWHSAQVEDARGCRVEDLIYVDGPDSLFIKVEVTPCSYGGYLMGVAPLFCCDGRIEAEAVGGVPPYRWLWHYRKNTGSPYTLLQEGGSGVSDLCDGEYRIDLLDSNGNAAHHTLELVRPEPLQAQIRLIDDLRCRADSSASLSVEISGGTPPYHIRWDNGDSSLTRKHLPAGTYRLWVDDALHVRSHADFEIEAQESWEVEIHSDSTSGYEAQDGALIPKIHQGVGPYQFQWTWGEGSSTDSCLRQLGQGIYHLRITDHWGCFRELEAYVFGPSRLSLEAKVYAPSYLGSVQGVLGKAPADGRIDLHPQGGIPPYFYRWTHGPQSSQLEQLSAGTYSVEISDSKGNQIVGTYTLAATEALLLNVDIVQDISCHVNSDGALATRLSGGTPPYIYSWNTEDGTPHIENLAAGSYRLVVIDSLGVSASFAIEMLAPDALVVDAALVAPRCPELDNGSIRLQLSGGQAPYQALWSDSIQGDYRQGLRRGEYRVEVSDNNGCRQAHSIFLDDDLLAQLFQSEDIRCHGGTNGALQSEICGGTPPYVLRWSTGEQSKNIQNLSSGRYCLYVSDKKGQRDTVCINLDEPASLQAKLSFVSPLCDHSRDGFVLAQASGGTPPYLYRWGNGLNSPYWAQLSAGVYPLEILDRQACLRRDTVRLLAPPPLHLSLQALDPSCHGENSGSLQALVGGGTAPYRLAWSTGDSSELVEHLGEGRYSLVVHDANQCQQQIDTLLQSPPPLRLAIESYRLLCKGQSHQVSLPDSLLQYHWFKDGDYLFSSAHPQLSDEGLYTLLALDSLGCRIEDSLHIERIDSTIESRFWVSHELVVDESIVAVNVSTQEVDSLHWYYPSQAQIVLQSKEYLELVLSDTGRYHLGLTTYKHGCRAAYEVPFTVLLPSDDKRVLLPSSEGASGVTVFPNPASERLYIQILQSKHHSFHWSLIDIGRGILVKTGQLAMPLEESKITEEISLSLLPRGYYLLYWQQGDERGAEKIFVK